MRARLSAQYPLAWCHGAPGVALGRFPLADLDPLQDILERTDDHREFPIGPTPPTALIVRIRNVASPLAAAGDLAMEASSMPKARPSNCASRPK